MNIVAALAWYDEPLDLLDACVHSLAAIADRVLAYDGGYRRFPGAEPWSHPSQAEAIRAAAKAVGLACRVVTPNRTWAGQVEKRSAMMADAARSGDWIAVIDSDHIVHTKREAARAYLGQTDADCINVNLYTPPNASRPIERSAAHTWHRDLSGQTVTHGFLFRSYPGFQVERFHYWYSVEKAGRRVWVYGEGQGEHGPSAFYPDITIEHRCLARDEAHVMANRAFLNDREMVVRMTGQEDDQPGLPRPVWDYERMAVG